LLIIEEKKERESSEFYRRRRHTMTKGRNTAEILGSDGELDDIELSESGDQGRSPETQSSPSIKESTTYSTGCEENKVYVLPSDRAPGRRCGLRRGMDL
jgi:hypothetical protein